MQNFTEIWNQIMSFAVFGGIIACLFLAGALVFPHSSSGKRILSFANRYILSIGFLISLCALASSLVYSEVIGYPPCLFCWLARIAFYPQVILYGMAIAKRDRNILDYSLGLTIFGIIVAAYHSIIQVTGTSIVPCSVSGTSCVTRFVFEYGFVTIPLMGLVGFLALFFSIIAAKRGSKISAL